MKIILPIRVGTTVMIYKLQNDGNWTWDINGLMQEKFNYCINRHRENFLAFTGPRIDFGLILLISNMVIHRNFTGPIHLLSANVWGPVSFAVSALSHQTRDAVTLASGAHFNIKTRYMYRDLRKDHETISSLSWEFLYIVLVRRHLHID